MRSFTRLIAAAALAALTALAPGAVAASQKALRYPSLTPDGKQVVFCYRGDIWIAPIDGSARAERLTIHVEQDTLCRVSPDGKRIAFSSKRGGNYDIWVVPITGGVPEQLTVHSAVDIICDWSPDGKKILMMSNRHPGPGRMDLYEIDLDGGTPRRITRDGGREGAYSKDGKTIVYARGFNSIYWDNYEGSGNYDLYTVPAAGGLPTQLTKTAGNERYPFFSADGATIYFVAEERGVANFYSMPAAGGDRAQVTKYAGNDVHRPDPNWDGETVVFERAGALYWTDLSKPAPSPKAIPVKIESDVRNSGIEVRTITSGGEQVHVSRDGRTSVFALRGDIWTMPSNGGNATRLTQGPSIDQWPRLSPDGKTIAYFSNLRQNNDIWLLDVASGNRRPATTHSADDFFHNWSPDGKKLVFCSERSGNRDIWVKDLESGSLTQLTKHPGADDDPSWSPDGAHIAFDSNRAGTQAIFVMEADGTNVRRVTQGTGFFQVPSWSPDGRMLVFEAFQPASGGSSGLFVVSVNGGPTMQVARSGETAYWAGDYIYYSTNRGGPNANIYRVKAPESVDAGERIPFVGTVRVDLKKELEQLFDEAWTALGNGFYDKKMHGVDWKAMRKKYRAMAVDAENKDEFHNVMRQMLAELGASHLGIFGGQQTGNTVAPETEANGYLGLDFADPNDEGARVVLDVLAGGPADEAGIRAGDVVTKLGRRKLKENTNLAKVLAGTVGKDLVVTYRPKSAEGLGPERQAKLKPVHAGQLSQLQYKAWTAKNARVVEDATKTKKGEVAYLHLSQMNGANLQKFQQAIAKWTRDEKVEGLILDVRDNGGGNIHNQLMQILTAKPLARVQQRGGPKLYQPTLHWGRPVVVLINERSFSDAEVFPFMFKEAGLGKVIGVPTAGGVIGTQDITLSDGSRFRIPRTGFWGMDGTNLEGLGVKPDILVEETPEDRLAGRDPQLQKAIEVVQAEVAAREAEAAAKKKPEPKPAPEPDKPAPDTAPEPAPENPAVAADALNPLADAAVGEWVRYRATLPGKDGELVVKVTVSKVADGAVEFEKTVEKGEGDVPALPARLEQQIVLDLLGNFGKFKEHVVHDGKIKDTETEVCICDVEWPDGTPLQFHFSNVVPAYGLWKVTSGDETILEALEWGAKPASPPAATEATPATPEPAAGEHPHPLYDAVAGEWLTVRLRSGQQEGELTIKVVEVLDEEIVFEQTISFNGQERTMPPMRRPRKKTLSAPDRYELVGFGTDKVTVGDKTYECVVMTATDPNGVEMKWWISKEVPVDGRVKVERDGEIVMELLEFGKE